MSASEFSRSLSFFLLVPGGFILLRRTFFICSLCLFFCGVYLANPEAHVQTRIRDNEKKPVKQQRFSRDYATTGGRRKCY